MSLRSIVVLCVIQWLFLESICEFIEPDVEIEVFTECFKISIPGTYRYFDVTGKVKRKNSKDTEPFSDQTSSPVRGALSFVFPISLNKREEITFAYTAVPADGVVGLGHPISHKVTRILPSRGVCKAKSPTKENLSGNEYETGDLIYEEYFNTNCISNKTEWTVEHKFPKASFSISYQKCSCKVDVENKVLRITPRLTKDHLQTCNATDLSIGCTAVTKGERCEYTDIMPQPPPQIIGGRVTSKRAFQYGRFVIEAQVPKGDWLYSDISLVPHVHGEDDIVGKMMMMTRGNGNLMHQHSHIGNKVLNTIVTNGTTRVHSQLNPFTECLGESYHKYEIDWSPDGITFSVDDQVRQTISSTDRNVYTKHFDGLYLSLSMGVQAGGWSVFPDDVKPSKPWKNGNVHTNNDLDKTSSTWYPTWDKYGEMLVKSVKIFAV